MNDRDDLVGRYQWSDWSCTNSLAIVPATILPQATTLAHNWMNRVAAACSRFRPDSEISRLHAGWNAVSPLLADLLQTALEVRDRTNGLVDPAVGRVLEAIGYDRSTEWLIGSDLPISTVTVRGDEPNVEGCAHTSDAMAAAAGAGVRIDGRRVFVPEGVVLDLGATAKAATADVIARDCVERLGGGALVSLGGDLATCGEFPGRGWQVVVQDTDDDCPLWVTLHGDGGLATSSTRHRAWRIGGKSMHHIVDPRTRQPASTIWSNVTVAAADCVTANGWSTAAIVAGSDAIRLLREHRIAARLMRADGRVVDLGLIDHGIPDANTTRA